MKATREFDGKTNHYGLDGKLYRNSKRLYKFACIATVTQAGNKSLGKSFIVSLGNDKQSTYNSMAQYYKRWCDLEVVEIEKI